MNPSESNQNKSYIAAGALFIAGGLLILMSKILPQMFSIGNLWPVFMLIPVVILIAVYLTEGQSASGVLIPIGIIGTLALFFFYLNFANSWDHMNELWPVFVLSPAIGFYLYFFATGEKGILIPAFILTTIAVIFFVLLSFSVQAISLILILIGAGFLLYPFISGSMRKTSDRSGKDLSKKQSDSNEAVTTPSSQTTVAETLSHNDSEPETQTSEAPKKNDKDKQE